MQKLGSYSAAARQLSMTRQAVHQLVGPGVSDGMRVAVVCVDGVRSMVTQRDGSEPRCPRCKAHLKRINYGGVVIGSIGAIAEPSSAR